VAAQWLPLCPLVGPMQLLECLCHFCNIVNKKRMKQENKNMQVEGGNNENAVHNCFITTIAEK
jgi:hypothetical protein